MRIAVAEDAIMSKLGANLFAQRRGEVDVARHAEAFFAQRRFCVSTPSSKDNPITIDLP
jgi:hypothetical protein